MSSANILGKPYNSGSLEDLKETLLVVVEIDENWPLTKQFCLRFVKSDRNHFSASSSTPYAAGLKSGLS